MPSRTFETKIQTWYQIPHPTKKNQKHLSIQSSVREDRYKCRFLSLDWQINSNINCNCKQESIFITASPPWAHDKFKRWLLQKYWHYHIDLSIQSARREDRCKCIFLTIITQIKQLCKPNTQTGIHVYNDLPALGMW